MLSGEAQEAAWRISQKHVLRKKFVRSHGWFIADVTAAHRRFRAIAYDNIFLDRSKLSYDGQVGPCVERCDSLSNLELDVRYIAVYSVQGTGLLLLSLRIHPWEG
jgi:hypothetical protein